MAEKHAGLRLSRDGLFSFDETLCVHCGACVAHCFADAFAVESETARIVWDEQKCVSCGICIPACGYGALSLVPPAPRPAEGGPR